MASLRKSTRAIKKSERARESDEFIPGIDSAASMASLTPAPSSIGTPCAPTHLPSPQPSPGQTSVKSSTKPDATAPKQQTANRVAKKHARKSTTSTSKAAASTMPALRNTAPARGQAPPTQPASAPRDLLTRLQCRIYPWPSPAPSSLETMTDWHKDWKQEQDVKEAMYDQDEDLDDWFVKSGNAAAYSTTTPVLSLQYSIARSFILRAKRAFRAGSSWEDFEMKELLIDSMSQARAINDVRLKAIHMREAVDNNLRLAIYREIRQRLCEEIWLQPFDHGRRHYGVGHGGTSYDMLYGPPAPTEPVESTIAEDNEPLPEVLPEPPGPLVFKLGFR